MSFSKPYRKINSIALCNVHTIMKYNSYFTFFTLYVKGDNVLGSVRPSVYPSALSRLNRLTYNHHYQSKVIFWVSLISLHLWIIAGMQ